VEKKQRKPPVRIDNRKAKFEYELQTKYEAGIRLQGSEVKSIRENGATLNGAYCYIKDHELYIKGMHISELKNASQEHDPNRERKLLLRKKEILKIELELKNQGLTLVPTLLYSKKGLIKLEIAIAKGKKLYDKRESIKKRDVERDLKRQED
jgi:SsrA-binding protein